MEQYACSVETGQKSAFSMYHDVDLMQLCPPGHCLLFRAGKTIGTCSRAPRKIGPGVALGPIHSICCSGSLWSARAELEFFEVPSNPFDLVGLRRSPPSGAVYYWRPPTSFSQTACWGSIARWSPYSQAPSPAAPGLFDPHLQLGHRRLPGGPARGHPFPVPSLQTPIGSLPLTGSASRRAMPLGSWMSRQSRVGPMNSKV